MARTTIASEKNVLEQVKCGSDAISQKKLKPLALEVAANPMHPLHKSLNSYPPIPFEICQDDLKVIAMLKEFPKPIPEDHKWTPLEKIFWAVLWKDGKLKSIKKIIEGAEHVVNKKQSLLYNGVVYHYFGRHLMDRVREPIIDQHTTRAFRLLTKNPDDDLNKIRSIASVANEDAIAYCKWYIEITTAEEISNYDESRKIDSYLFALGKYAKIKKKS